MARKVGLGMAIYILSLCGGIEAAEIRVPSDHKTIQAALNAAVAGDTVIVSDGTYKGESNRDLDFKGKAITLRSENGPNKCIINCQGSEANNHRGVYFNSGETQNTILDGFTITNGYMSGGGVFGNGGGIYVRNCSPTILNCILRDNYAVGGGGVDIQNSQSQVENCVMQHNSSESLGGGIIVVGSENEPNIVACLISDNVSGWDGGGIACNEGNVNLVQCRILRNQAISRRGGGVSIDESNATITDCVIQDNVASWAGGVIFTDGSSIMNNCVIRGNTQHGLYYNFTDLDVYNCLIEGSYHNDYYPVVIRGSTSVVRNCTFVGNRGEVGAIIIHDESEVAMSNCIVRDIDAENSFTIKQSTATISYSNIDGGQANIILESGGILNWGDGNLNVEPNFVAPGEWQDNDTPADQSDDTWVIGCYHLMSGSDCIDVGDDSGVEAGETALGGQNRILNSVVDMGAYEFAEPEEFMVESVTIKAGKSREAQKDSFSLEGVLEAEEADFLAADYVTLRFGPWAEALDASAFKQSGKKPKYSYKGPSGGVTSMVLDFSKDTFSAAGKNLDLSGTSAPMILIFLIGDTYYAYTEASDEEPEDVINGDKTLPIQLLLGFEDALEVTKVKAKQGKENNVGNLTVQGLIAVEAFVDLTTTGLTIHWGTESYSLAGADFNARGTNKYIGKVKPSGGDSSSATVTLDFNKCTFKVTLKNTDMTWQVSPVNFGLEFDGFNQSQSVEFD
jgi:hypothetical protein